ncbi:flagellar hook-length control protein FliK [Arthrobacter sp. RHLT1-20]
MKGLDLAAAPAAPVPGRGTQPGARSRSEAASPDAGSFDAVFNDVHNNLPDKAPDADAAVRDAPADAGAQDPSDASAKNAAAYAGNAQLAAGSAGNQRQATQQDAPAAAPGLPVTGDPELSPATAAAAAGATAGPDPRLAVPGALLGGISQTAAVTATPAVALVTATTPAVALVTPTTPAVALVTATTPAVALVTPTTPATATTPVSGQGPALQSGDTGPVFAHATRQAAAQPLAPGAGGTAPLGTPAEDLPAAAPAAAAVPGNAAPGGASATAAAPSTVTSATLATAMATGGASASRAAVVPAEVKTARTNTAAPTDALAAAGAAAAATPPANQPATAAAAPVPQPAAQAPSQPGATLQPQLAKPLFTLAGAPHGQHIMTLQVTPEDLGPMTVRAHIDAGGVRIELFAPGDAGREAIRGILPELRKELADAGFGASLDVSEHGGPGTAARDGAGQDAAGRDGTGRDGGSGPGSRNGTGEPRPGHRWEALADAGALRNTRILNGPQTTLDILV